jgi:cytochrome c5
VLLPILVVVLVSTGCERGEPEEPPVSLAAVDSVLSELGGMPTARLERGQRWRMISSIGAGLPPSDFQPEDLPEPRSRGAGLLQVYCVQCHWLPAPQMHSAAEWPILVRRMVLRSRTLKERMGGPLTTGLVGDLLMRGMQVADLPSEADLDTLISYLQEHALPAAEPGEVTDDLEGALFVQSCTICHETPSPRAHTAAGWEQVVARMRTNMSLIDLQPLSDEQTDRIVAYLRARSGSSSAN